MSEFPAEPISPARFIEEVVPALFSEIELEAEEKAVDLRLGVVLSGADGGDWTLHFREGGLQVGLARTDECQLTVIQRVEDWRAALWEGRPALIAAGVDRVRDGGTASLRPDPLKGISDLRGRIELVIESHGGSSADPEAPDWAMGILVGEGPIPETPQATIRLGAAEADLIQQDKLHPLEALITGQLQLDGDLGLILQLQAVAMTLSMAGGMASGKA